MGIITILCAQRAAPVIITSVNLWAGQKIIWGPYEPDPCNPILTSSPGDFNERSDWDHLKPRYYNPDSVLQKSGHASYVDLQNGETWMVHLTARPFVPELRCTLGRETAIQRMKWTEDGWLRSGEWRQ